MDDVSLDGGSIKTTLLCDPEVGVAAWTPVVAKALALSCSDVFSLRVFPVIASMTLGTFGNAHSSSRGWATRTRTQRAAVRPRSTRALGASEGHDCNVPSELLRDTFDLCSWSF